jgi:hypothetical protein
MHSTVMPQCEQPAWQSVRLIVLAWLSILVAAAAALPQTIEVLDLSMNKLTGKLSLSNFRSLN